MSRYTPKVPLSSQYMQHLYKTTNFSPEEGKFSLAVKLYKKACEQDHSIPDLTKSIDKLSGEYGNINGGGYAPVSNADKPVNKATVKALKEQMAKGEIPIPAFDFNKRGEVQKFLPDEANHFLAARQLELDIAYGKLDKAFAGFEEQFFKTPEGEKFRGYIEAAAKKDFTEFLRDHPLPKKEAEKVAENLGATAEKTETGLGKQAEKLLSNATEWSAGEKWAVGGAATALVAVIGGWVWQAKHRNKEKAAEQGQGR